MPKARTAGAESEKTNETLAGELSESTRAIGPPRLSLSGEAASAAGRTFLLREYGSEEDIREAMRKPGRPRSVGHADPVTKSAGASPTVRSRIPRADFERLATIEAATGKSESDLIREGVAMVISRYAEQRDATRPERVRHPADRGSRGGGGS